MLAVTTPPKPTPEEQREKAIDAQIKWLTTQRDHFERKWKLEYEKKRSPTPADELIDWARSNFRFGRTRSGDTFVVDRVGPNVAHLFRRNSEELRHTLARRAREKFGDTPAPPILRAAMGSIHSEAAAAPPEALHLRLAPLPREAAKLEPEEVASRVAGGPLAFAGALPNQDQESHNASGPAETPNTKHQTLPKHETPNTKHETPTSIVLDLGREDGQSVIITPDGWRIIDRSPVPFRRTDITGELPIPERGGRLDRLRSLINVSDEGWPLLRAWLVASLFPSIAHPILLLRGMKGTGKRTALRILGELIDPSPVPLRTMPSKFDQWAVMAAAGWLVPLVNVASIPVWLNDALCRAVTGDADMRRRPYSQGGISVLAFRSVVALTSIDIGPLRADLADLLLALEIDPIDDARRREETELLESFERQKPQLFGALLDEVSVVLRRLPEVRLDFLPRLPDFAKILAALDVGPAPPAAPRVPRPALSPVEGAVAGAPPTEEQEFDPRNAQGLVQCGIPSPLTPNPSPLTRDGRNEQPQAAERLVRGEAKGGSLSVPGESYGERLRAVVSDCSGTEGGSARNSDRRDGRDGSRDGRDGRDGSFETFFNTEIRDGRGGHPSALSTYLDQNRRLAAEVVEGDPLGPAVAQLVESRGVWEGTATDLLSAVAEAMGKSDRDRPRTPRALSGRLRLLAPSLASIGIAVDFHRLPGNNRSRQIRLASAVKRAPPNEPREAAE